MQSFLVFVSSKQLELLVYNLFIRMFSAKNVPVSVENRERVNFKAACLVFTYLLTYILECCTELLQPLDLVCGTLPVQLRNPDITYRLFRRQLKRHLLGNQGLSTL